MSHLPKLRLRTERNDVASLSTSPDVKGLLQALLRISTATHWPALDGTQPRQPGSAPPSQQNQSQLALPQTWHGRLDKQSSETEVAGETIVSTITAPIKPRRLRPGRRAMSVSWKRKVFLGIRSIQHPRACRDLSRGDINAAGTYTARTIRQSFAENK